MQRRRLASSILVFALCAALEVPTSGQDDSTTFRTSTQLVLVPVVVKDRSRHVVSGLRATDFSIAVDDKPQVVAQFEEVHQHGQAAITKPTLRPGEYSNARLTSENPIGLTIIMLDLINTPFEHQVRARDQLIKFLTRSLQPEQYLSILALTSTGLRKLHDLTNNNEELIEALRGTRSEVNRASSAESEKQLPTSAADGGFGPSTLGSELRQVVEQEFRDFMMTNQRQLTMEAMVQIAQAYKSIPGRKNLIWTTAGFPFYLHDSKSFAGFVYGTANDYESVWRQLNDANISVYPVDVRGVFDPLWDAEYAPFNTTFDRAAGEDAMYDYWSTRSTMRNFAEATGGNACLGNNDMPTCYADTLDDAGDYYMVNFYLAPELRTEGWHKLKVKVNGNYEVRARKGFTVSKGEGQSSANLEIVEALRSPIENNGLPFSLVLGQPSPYHESRNVITVSEGKKKKKLPVQEDRIAVAVVPFKITVVKNTIGVDLDHQNKFGLRIDAAVVTDKKEILSVFSKLAEGSLTPEGLEKFSGLEFTFADSIFVPPGTLRVRFALLDTVGHRLGTLEAPLVIPK